VTTWVYGFIRAPPRDPLRYCIRCQQRSAILTPVSTTNKESTQGQAQVVTPKRVYYVNKSSKDVRKIMSTLEGTVTPIYLCLTTHRLEILEVQFKPPNILTTALYNYILLNN
jgi:hypothetical protein